MTIMTNHNVLIKPDETEADIVAEICDDCLIGPDEPFAFSALMKPNEDPGYFDLRINCVEPSEENPYTVRQLIHNIISAKASNTGVRYVQPPFEQWLTIFRPLLMKMVTKAHPRYERLIPERDELISILYLTVTKLYHKGYYLHQTLIYRSFINDLNLEVRKLKNDTITDSLDAELSEDDEGKPITLLDQLIDQDATDSSTQLTTYTSDDYWDDMYQKLRARMLQDMPEWQFNRILLQLKTNTIDRQTSYLLDKYRQEFNPGYTPRPNAKNKPKGGNKP
jgi:hypothetical protein